MKKEKESESIHQLDTQLKQSEEEVSDPILSA